MPSTPDLSKLLPDHSTDLSWSPLWLASRESDDVFVIHPRSFKWHIAISMLSFPAVVWMCLHFQAQTRLSIGLSLFPIFAGGGFLVGELLQRFLGRHATFDRVRRIADIDGHSIPWNDLRAVQVLEHIRDGAEDGQFLVIQLNLIYETNGTLTRRHLLQGIHGNLFVLANELAEFLAIPLGGKFVAREQLRAISRGARATMVLFLVVGMSALAGAVWAFRIEVNPKFERGIGFKTPEDRRFFVGILATLGAGFVVLSGLGLRTMSADLRQRSQIDGRLPSQHGDGHPK